MDNSFMKTSKLTKIYQQLEQIEKDMLTVARNNAEIFDLVHPAQKRSARNLMQYLSLRTKDIRKLQDLLHVMGLSSLASSEGHIHKQLQSILERLGKHYTIRKKEQCTHAYSKGILHQRSTALFGDKQIKNMPSVMVTFDKSFVDNYAQIKNLLLSGMNVARINCAHDDETVWSQMTNMLKEAILETGIPCKIYMDLAGPKIRTILTRKGKKKGKVKVQRGDLIWLSETTEGFKKKDIVISPNEKGIIPNLRPGDRIFIDDGMIKAEINELFDDRVSAKILRVSNKNSQIKNEKGINFPDTTLEIPSLTEYDLACLPFVCAHADIVGYSFVRYPKDVRTLQSAMNALCDKQAHIILKIETPAAVKYLPDLLIQSMRNEVFGVMIARGDLAVEIGFERLSEIQEEILWICEAAHVPVIWATQVLETLNKSGLATRSEITDAAHAAVAECIMVNKGAHTIEVIETLREIMTRMGGHHIKKRFTFRPLSIAKRFMRS
jgi:pyruvate kinase